MARWNAARALPEPARSKYRRLVGVAQDRQAASRRAYDDVEELRERVAKARISYELANRSPLTSVEGIARVKEPVAEFEAEIARLIQERDERGERAQGITALVNRLENFIGDLPLTSKVTLFNGVLPARKKGEALIDTVTHCRSEIEKLHQRIDAIRDAPRPLEECIARATAEIEALAQRGEPDMDGLLAEATSIGWPTRQLDLLARTRDGAVVAANGSTVDAMAVLAWLFKSQLTKAVTTVLREQGSENGDAMPMSERPKRIADLRASMLEIERVEEQAIEEIEATGAAFERRPDADPRAVLVLSSELPAPRDDT